MKRLTTVIVRALVQAAVPRAWEEHVEAARKKDLSGVLAIYADDAVYEPFPGTTAPTLSSPDPSSADRRSCPWFLIVGSSCPRR